jgi:hypothetical protein
MNSAKGTWLAGQYDKPMPELTSSPSQGSMNSAKDTWLSGQYDSPMPELTLSPSQGSMNSATGSKDNYFIFARIPKDKNFSVRRPCS